MLIQAADPTVSAEQHAAQQRRPDLSHHSWKQGLQHIDELRHGPKCGATIVCHGRPAPFAGQSTPKTAFDAQGSAVSNKVQQVPCELQDEGTG